MLTKEKIDALAIAVIPDVQYAIAKVAIKKGLHIFAEKPLTANVRQARELAALAKKHKVVTTVDFIFPEIDEWKKAKELIDSRVYGKLNHISVDWEFLSYDIKNKVSSWKTDVSAGGGGLAFFLSHALYYVENFAGKITQANGLLSYSKASLNGGETGVDLNLRFGKNKSPVTGNIHFRCDAIGKNTHNVTFYFDRGTLVLQSDVGVTDHFTLTAHEMRKEGVVTEMILCKKHASENGEDERVKIVKRIASRFIEGCEKKKQVSPSFVDGLRVQNLIELIRKAKS